MKQVLNRFGLRWSLISIALLCMALISMPAAAQRPPHPSNGLDNAVRKVEKRTGGRVLSADKRRVDDQYRYRIKVLTPRGRVRIIYMDVR